MFNLEFTIDGVLDTHHVMSESIWEILTAALYISSYYSSPIRTFTLTY